MSDLLQFVVALPYLLSLYLSYLHNKKVCAIISKVLWNFKI